MSSVVKMLQKGEVGGGALNSHRKYIVVHGKSWKNHGIVFLNFCGHLIIIAHDFPIFKLVLCFQRLKSSTDHQKKHVTKNSFCYFLDKLFNLLL